MRLPEKFTEQMKNMLGDDLPNYIEALDRPMYHALRINTLKISVEDFLKISPFKLTPVPWCSNAFYYDAETEFRIIMQDFTICRSRVRLCLQPRSL